MHNKIHPTAIISEGVKLGVGNEILPYTVLIGPLEIGDHNIIGPNVVIGSPGQDTRNPRYDSSQSPIKIGNGNIIREFTAIQKPCYTDITSLGDDIYLMQGVHIPHDAIIEDQVVITPMVALAGITRILRAANLGLGCVVNQYCVIGQYSIVAAGAAAMKNVRPFSRFIPGKSLTVNEYAVKKYGYDKYQEQIERYVLEKRKPLSDELLSITEHYEKLHIESNRGEY